MILKGSQRANGADLAVHLMNGLDNEHVEIAALYGAVSDDLHGAFTEFEAVAAGTKASRYLYSLSINPPEPLTRAQYDEAIEVIAKRLGLAGQPHAVVFHIKDGREHCHVVWSRIDASKMRAIHMAHDRRKLMDLACELAHRFGVELPPGLKAWEQQQKFQKDKLEPSLAEKAQAEQTGINPEQRREEISACYEQSDSAASFRAALEQKGYMLARGDRRGFVVIDRHGGVHSLSRYVAGHNSREISKRLAAIKDEGLPSVDEAKELMRQRREASADSERERHEKAMETTRKAMRDKLEALQGQRQLELRQAEQELLTRQQSERLALHAAQATDRKSLLFRVRRAVAALIARMPALRSVLRPVQKLTHLDPQQRHELERQALDRRHARERSFITRRKRLISRLATRENHALEKALRRKARLADLMKSNVRQDFYEAARDLVARKRTDMDDGALGEVFNEAAEQERQVRQAGEDERRAKGWKKGAELNDGDLGEAFNAAADPEKGARQDKEEDEGFRQDWKRRTKGLRRKRPRGKGRK